MTNDMMMEREMDHEEDELTRLPNTSKLRSALSVQNLLDVDDKVSDVQQSFTCTCIKQKPKFIIR